LRFLN